jgi:hypothetical protein
MGASVTAEVDDALRRVSAGESVVLIVDASDAPVSERFGGPGRVAVFVGSPEDPDVWDAARQMADELFGRPR